MSDTTLPQPIADRITIRRATTADIDRVSDVINDPPSVSARNIAGSVEKAIRAGRVLARAGVTPILDCTVVAELDGRIVAIMDASAHHPEFEMTAVLVLRLLPAILRTVGPGGLWRLLRSRPAWNSVSFPADAEAYYISELDVDAAYRSRGIGAVLLRYGEEQALAAGCPRMTLTTDITNPAQHLYERFGFRITATKTDSEFERWAGSPGRVWMVKELG